MTSANAAFRALIIYGLVLPTALIVGYMLATPYDAGSLVLVLLVLGLLCLPLLLKWHHPLLLLTWNMSASIGLVPGNPQLWFLLAFLSFAISVSQRALVRDVRLFRPSPVLLPMAFMALVVLITAEFTGGLGMRVMGSNNFGGRRYLLILAAILGHFAIAAKPIPVEKAQTYVGLYFLGPISNVVSNLIPYGPTWMYWLALFFPVAFNDLGTMATELGFAKGSEAFVARFYGLSTTALLVFSYLLARWDFGDLLSGKRLWRLLLLVGVVVAGCFGGFRGYLVQVVLIAGAIFVIEGLWRTKHLFVVLTLLFVAAVFLVAAARHLPLSMQRTISFLPVEVDTIARLDAQNSTNWRVDLWNSVLPQVPKYLLLGKGLSVDGRAIEMENQRMVSLDAYLLASDLHSGPLTVIIPFGIWGVLAWCWFVIAGIRLLNLNRLHGNPALLKTNNFLLAFFVAKVIFFFLVFGNFYTDLATFTGILGLSIALNDGVRRPVLAPLPTSPTPTRRLRPPMRPTPEFSP